MGPRPAFGEPDAPGALIAAGGLLAVAVPPLLADRASGDRLEDEQSASVLSRLVVVLALLATLAAGIEGWLRARDVRLGARRAAARGGPRRVRRVGDPARARRAAGALALGALLLALLG